MDINDFEKMWDSQQDVSNDPKQSELDERTPEYMIKDGIARYKLLTSFLAVYFHAKHGEPMTELFGDDNESEIIFRLNEKKICIRENPFHSHPLLGLLMD